jgi:hypothetical protein
LRCPHKIAQDCHTFADGSCYDEEKYQTKWFRWRIADWEGKSMSTSYLESWKCPRCGQNNGDHPTICSQCDYNLSLSDNKSSNDRSEESVASIHPREISADRFIGQSPETAEENSSNVDSRIRNSSLVVVSVSAVVWVYLAWEFHKWDAKWGPINVLIVALVAAALMGWWISRRAWYRDRSITTRWRLIIIPVAGFILCASGGIYFTEPIEAGGAVTRSDSRAGSAVLASAADRRSSDYRYNYNLSRASDYYLFSSILDLGGGVDDVDVDEGCFVVLLVILVIALILGSVMIPHFWIGATFVLLVIMAMVANREWRNMTAAGATGRQRP